LTTPAYQRERRRLAEALKALRVGAGFSGTRLAGMLGWGPAGQSKVSKIETLKQLPSEDDIAAWAGATSASPETAAELLAMLRGARVESVTWKDAFREAGADGVQADILAYEAQSARIAEFQPAMISGLVQTADYAREMLRLPCGPLSFGADEDELERMVDVRMQRQRVLYGRDHQVTVIMLQAALRSRVVSVPVLAGQLTWLMSASGLSALELGIIPDEAPLPVYPLSGFRLYDDLVIVESIERELELAESDQVARYEKYLEQLRGAAVTGDEARRLIAAAAAELREGP
jgi:transcriptional regulator with XRE-family HTH domain